MMEPVDKPAERNLEVEEENEMKSNHIPMKFHFRNIGPAKDAEMELGDLTIIAGRNNTGKTYLVYTLYGFLKTRDELAEITGLFLSDLKLSELGEQLRREGVASFSADGSRLHSQRREALHSISQYFSSDLLLGVFSSRSDNFEDSSIDVTYTRNNSVDIDFPSVRYAMRRGRFLSIKCDTDRVVMEIEKMGSQFSASITEHELAFYYVDFLLRDLCPRPFILSAERFGISLFYRELDFTKNQLVDILQKMGDQKHRERFSPFSFVDRTTSRYARPIKDNIDYTRSIPDLRRTKSALWKDKFFDNIKDMMEGYYGASDDEIRFISKARGEGRSFNIPLHLASSSARGLSDLYFFLRHVARKNHLLIIDEPESHLDTANQIQLARLLARFVRSGLKVLITTHSDYIIKEINNLVMLNRDFEEKDAVLRRLGYARDDALNPVLIRAYVAENGGLTRCEIDKFGIDMPVFDRTIEDINRAANELAFCIRQGEED